MGSREEGEKEEEAEEVNLVGTVGGLEVSSALVIRLLGWHYDFVFIWCFGGLFPY